jgi:predicted membrane protein
MRLRHYFYRKTFWFELKEILRTLVIFAVIEIAVLAFANWSFSRFLWGLTWVLFCYFAFGKDGNETCVGCVRIMA